MRSFAVAAVVGMLSAVSAGAQDCTTTVQTNTPGKLTVAAYDYPPFTSVAADGSISGIDPTIIEAIAVENCLEVVPLVMDPAATIQSVVSGRADVAIGSWNRTKARSEILGISAPTYLDPMGIFSNEGFTQITQLEGKTIGTVTGYLWVPDLQKLFGSSLKLYPNAVTLSQDLEAGRIEAAVDAYNYGLYNQQTSGALQGIKIELAEPDERVVASREPAQAGILYTKDNSSLGEAVDAGITKLHAEGAIEKLITDAGYDAQVAAVGEPRLVE